MRNNSFIKTGIFCAVALLSAYAVTGQQKISLANDRVKLEWAKSSEGWKLLVCAGAAGNTFLPFGEASGLYTMISSKTKPSDTALQVVDNGKALAFPEKNFKYVYPDFQRAISAVPMNRAGEHISFYPASAEKRGDSIVFKQVNKEGVLAAIWKLDKKYSSDILVQLRFTAAEDGYYSLSSPALSTVTEQKLDWATVPGYFQGNYIQSSFPLAYTYAQGLPAYPVLCRESTITTMASIMSDKNGLTMAVIPTPGQDRNAYAKDAVTHFSSWKIALSHMNAAAQLTPTAYHPVLGEEGSFLKKGQSTEFSIRITLEKADWYQVYKHAVYDIYQLRHLYTLQENTQSLSERLMKQYAYVLDDKTAFWNKEKYKGREIMAQSYLGGVAGADKDAMKNSDIGAVWMLSKLTSDSQLYQNRIPYIRNFKIMQQTTEGFFKGAVAGQYYLAKKKEFTEEWGNHFEPVAVTYYTMMDLGNILLFEKDNKELKELLRNGAERLLEWQHPAGNWDLAYDRDTKRPIYNDLQDLRPTFYGLIIAYQILKEKKYLDAAIKGAKWLIKNGTEKGAFVGVCGDARFVNDFATIQCAGAFLSLFEITKDKRYLDAAITTAKIYTTSIYTHPIPGTEVKTLKNQQYQDWQLSQVGLNFEHGGTMGSAVKAGPILLTSHCSFFLKMFQVTKDSLFLDLARMGALGKDAFVNKSTGVASYYWNRFDEGPGVFPHHGWWQIGWIYDYLVAEAELRSGGKISFPRGFMTPKVGPHKPVGFEPGLINGVKADLVIRKGLVQIDNPNIDYITALSENGKDLYIILLNSQDRKNKLNISIDPGMVKFRSSVKKQTKTMTLPAFGYQLIKVQDR